MSTSRALAIAVGVVLLAGCSARHKAPSPATPSAEASGFLDDYTALRPGGADDVALVYRNPDADWKAYDKVLLEPVTLWRSGKNSLSPMTEADLLRIANDFEAAVRRRLGRSFTVVDAPGPGVLLVRLGITEARASDPVLDVLTASAGADEAPAGDVGPLPLEVAKFVANAAIEGEVRDARTRVLLAQGVDRRPPGVAPATTWSELDQRFARWADRVCGGLAVRTGQGG